MNTKELVKELKNRLKISDVAQQLGCEIFPSGNMRCIFPERHSHGDRTPSVTLNDEYNTFKCWVCDDVNGDIISLVRLKNNATFSEALQILCDMAGIEYPTYSYKQSYNNSNNGFNNVSSKRSNLLDQNHLHLNSQNNDVNKTEIKDNSKSDENKTKVFDSVKNNVEFQQKRLSIIKAFLRLLEPPSGAGLYYLKKRQILDRVIRQQYILMIHDYAFVNERLKSQFQLEDLQEVGMYSLKGNLKFYKHPLIFPYFDLNGTPVYFQSRAIDSSVVPKELSLKGNIPCPYNMRVLNKRQGLVYVCEGVIDTLSLIQFNNDAVGIPGVKNFKPEWVSLFENKRVIVAFDEDEAGRQGRDKVIELLESANIEVKPSKLLKEGMDMNDFFNQKRF